MEIRNFEPVVKVVDFSPPGVPVAAPRLAGRPIPESPPDNDREPPEAGLIRPPLAPRPDGRFPLAVPIEDRVGGRVSESPMPNDDCVSPNISFVLISNASGTCRQAGRQAGRQRNATQRNATQPSDVMSKPDSAMRNRASIHARQAGCDHNLTAPTGIPLPRSEFINSSLSFKDFSSALLHACRNKMAKQVQFQTSVSALHQCAKRHELTAMDTFQDELI